MAYKRKFRARMRRPFKGKRGSYMRRSASKKKGGIKNLIRREIARNVENKIKDTELAQMNLTQTIDDTHIQQLIPQIGQGTTQSTRIGNRVKVKKFNLRLAITMSNLGANASPTYVDVYIFKPKFQTSYSGIIPAIDMTYFLQNDSSSEQYNGAILDGLRYVNSDLFTLCLRRRLLMFNPVTSLSTVAATSSINPNRTLNIDLTKHVKKNLMFDDSVGSCTNDTLYIGIGTTQTDGAIFFTNVGSYLGLVQMIYEDA